MQNLLNIDAPAWYKFITDFDPTYKTFTDNYKGLIASRNFVYTKHPALRPEYDRLLSEGTKNYNKLTQLKKTRDDVKNWLGGIKDWAKSIIGMDGLGILPVVALSAASAIAALSAVAYWSIDAYKFAARLNKLRDLEAGGMSPGAAAQVVDVALGPVGSGSGILGGNLKWIVIGVGLFLLYPVIRDTFVKRK